MRNTHILSTVQPSRLCLTREGYILGEGYSLSTDECHNKHIHITSGDEIKEGDWVILNDSEFIKKLGKFKWFGSDEVFEIIGGGLASITSCRKVIMTTDLELVKDGVQVISDEFLEWFVNKPSCEYVEVNRKKVILGEVAGTTYTDYEYKLVIPEDLGYTTKMGIEVSDEMVRASMIPKEYFGMKETLEEKEFCHYSGLPSPTAYEGPKETIEEATEAYADIHMEKFDIVSSDRLPYFHNDRHKIEDSFEAGAEWQKKQSEKTMYSEQEVDELIYNIIGEYGKHYGIMIDGGKLNELREQFKKK